MHMVDFYFIFSQKILIPCLNQGNSNKVPPLRSIEEMDFHGFSFLGTNYEQTESER